VGAHRSARQRRGLTLVEFLFASALSTLVAGIMVILVMVMTRANQALYSEDLVLQEGDRIMRNLEVVLRSGSRGQGGISVFAAGNLSGSSCTARVRVPRSSGITGAVINYTSEIRFSTAAGPEQNRLIVDPNIATTTDALQTLSKKSTSATDLKPYVTNVQFSTPIDPNTGNTPVASSIRVSIKLVAPGTWLAWRGSSAESQRVIVRTITLREP
jgi:hypothetical protein